MDALRVEKLPNDKGGLQVADGGQVLCHGRVMVALAVQVVCIPPLNLSHHRLVRLHLSVFMTLPLHRKLFH